MIKFKGFLKKSIIVPVVVSVVLFGSSASAMVATGVIHFSPSQKPIPVNPAPITDGIKPSATGKVSEADQATIDKNSQVVEIRTKADGTKEYILASALDSNGVYHGPDANGCWNFTMTGAHIATETKNVCGDADIQAFRADYLARDAAASQPPTSAPVQVSTPTSDPVVTQPTDTTATPSTN